MIFEYINFEQYRSMVVVIVGQMINLICKFCVC